MVSSTTDFNLPTDKKLNKSNWLKIDFWLVAVLFCFTLLAWANWGKINAPIIDIGREVEISARLLSGQVLYRDIATYYGPLAYYTNALGLLVFGQRLEVFYAVGVSLALVATLPFYRLAKRLTCPSWAALCTICMLIYCAISPGLFHFILPYSYGAAYGIVLSLLAIAAVDCYFSTSKTRWLVLSAIACGLAGLAKQEYGVAALASVLIGVNLLPSQTLQTRIKRSLLILLISFFCVLIPFALLAQQASWEKLYSSLFPVSQVGIMNRSTIFQVSPIKTLHLWWASFKYFFLSSCVVLLSMIAAHWLLKRTLVKVPQPFRNLAEILTAFSFTTICFSLLKKFVTHPSQYINDNVFQSLKNMSWFIPVMIGWFALNRPKLTHYKHAPLLWTLLAFSLLLNSRWLLYINFYGLYAPTVILLFFTLAYYLTQASKQLAWCYLLICLLFAATIKIGEFTECQYLVTSSHGNFYTVSAELARAFNQTIKVINDSKATSVLVLPEGNILNFLTGTHSPSQQLTFLPLVLPTPASEQNFITQMQANPPELIVYVDRSFPEWGYKNYAQFNPLVDKWIAQQHRLIHVFPKDEGVIRIYRP
jgi:ABC-type multidrug transport system fused ATPase/permease subunit